MSESLNVREMWERNLNKGRKPKIAKKIKSDKNELEPNKIKNFDFESDIRLIKV